MKAMRDSLIELIQSSVGGCTRHWAEVIADHLLAAGCILPPCKVGDVVYMPWAWDGTKGIAILTVMRVSITDVRPLVVTDFNSDDYAYFVEYNCGVFGFDDFGKTVFLTKEEAERALAERREG